MKKKEENTPAGKTFHFNDYESSKETDQGLAIVHEQATDTYTEGSIDEKIERQHKK
ncbi:YozQ family protein [Bacillus sp. B190/17]|uniref:YozQ family protein n=1 Tax=Bacillus lumedeiriae TaxID=3058829 RepID=A0ABW8IB58_9BACI